MLKTDLVEHDFIKGFFRHPIFLHIYVSREGNVFNSDTGRFASSSKTEGYAYIGSASRPVHLLVLDTFVAVPDHLVGQRLIGNHLNGVTTDNRLDNLEWTNYQGNVEHAVRTGLRSDAIPVLVKDLRTSNVTRFYGIHETGRRHGVPGGTVHWYLKPENRGKIFNKFYVVIREGDDWPTTKSMDANSAGYSSSRQIYVKDYINKQRGVFNSVGQAAEYLGMNTRTLRNKHNRALSSGLIGYECEDFGIWHVDTYLKHKKISDDAVRHTPAKQVRQYTKPAKMPIPIVVTELSTGKKETWASSEEFAEKLGVKKNTFQQHIRANNGVWYKKIHVEYLTNEVLPRSNVSDRNPVN